jgi:hypothetical protein
MTVRVNKSSFNIREKLSELERPIGLKGSELMRAETAQEARDIVGAGRKNLLINGNFKIWQRSTDYDNTTQTWSYYSVDRFQHNRGRTRKVSAVVDGMTVDALEISPGANGYDGGRGFLQKVEEYKIYEKQMVISAYIKSDVPATCNFGFVYDNATATSKSAGKIINTTTEFQRFEVLCPVYSPSSSPDTYIITGLTAGVTYTVANAQLEFGKVATEFEHRSYGEELALCKRYYQRMGDTNGNEIVEGGYGTSGMGIYNSIQLPVEMRAVPTLTQVGSLYTVNVSQPGSLNSHRGRKGFAIASIVTNAGTWVYATNTGAYFVLDAEL